jgi:FMNH2-dependent dimethyl sulfone monooxygenase
MQFGVWTPVPHAIGPEPRLSAAVEQALAHPPAVPYADEGFAFARDVVTAADEQGFDITLVAERLLGPDLEAWMLSAALLAVTRRIHVMTAVHPGLWAPQLVAKMAASLDRISAGRHHLNVVTGWFEEEYTMFGGTWVDDEEARYQRSEEFLQVIKGLWCNAEYSFHGRFYQVERGRLSSRPVQQPYPPIYAATRSERGKDLIAREGDIWFLPYGPDYRDFAASLDVAERAIADMRERAARCGRMLQFGLSAHVICTDTLEEAHARAEKLIAHGQRDRLAAIAAGHLRPALVGPPDLIIERIQRYAAVGLDLLLMHFTPMQDGQARFAREVLPAVRGVGVATA